MQFHHLGVLVRSIEQGKRLVSVLGVQEWTETIEDPIQQVQACFGVDPAGLRFELIAPTTTTSPIASALKAGVNILNHIAYLVPDLTEAAERMREHRCAAIGAPAPAIAYDGKPIQFFITPARLLIELIES